jgi:hypothetical protein
MQWFAGPALDWHGSASAAIATETGACFGLSYDASGSAWVDPATTRLTIHRAGG